MLNKSMPYSSDPFTQNYGAYNVYEALYKKNGERYAKYRKDWEKAGNKWLPEFPLNLVFDLVDQCNLACPQCLRAPDIAKDYEKFILTSKYLDKKIIKKILLESKKYNLPSVNIGGSGECLLHPDFLEICKDISNIKPCEFRIISNGILLKEKIAEELINLNVDILSISIDATTPETFALTRGKAHRFEDVVNNAINFSKLKKKKNSKWPLLRVSFVEQEENKHETKEFLKFWSEYADMIDVQSYQDHRQKENFYTSFDCFEPFKRITVWAYGGAGPCCGFPGIKYNVGNFEKESIHKIWHGNKIKDIRKMMVTKDYEFPCLSCNGTRTVF